MRMASRVWVVYPYAAANSTSPKSDTIAPSDTIMRRRCDDSAPDLLPAGDCGTPVALRHAALRLAKPRRGVTPATRAPAVEAQAVQGAQTLCGSHHQAALRRL